MFDLTLTITAECDDAQAYLDEVKAKALAGEKIGTLDQVIAEARDRITFSISTGD